MRDKKNEKSSYIQVNGKLVTVFLGIAGLFEGFSRYKMYIPNNVNVL